MAEPYRLSLNQWVNFFDRYMVNDILSLARAFPDGKSLTISLSLMEAVFGVDGVDSILAYPDRALADAGGALHEFPLPIVVEGWNLVRVKFSGCPTTLIRSIRKTDLGTYRSFTASIMRKSEVRFQLKEAAFKCKRCEHVNFLPQTDGRLMEPYECENEVCGRKGPFNLVVDQSIFADKRKIRVQESLDQVDGGEQSLSTIDCVLLEDVDCPPLGNQATVSGIIRGIQGTQDGTKTTDFTPWLEVNNIEYTDSEQTIEISDSDRARMTVMAGEDAIIEKLVSSTVPSIKGHEIVKEACLCSIVSPGNFLLPDGRELRGHSHVMLCGDPSVAKSMLMLGLKKLVPRAQYAAGRGASAKGLTVSVTKDKWGGEGAWVAEAGMLVLADGALALIDEMDKWEREEQQELNTALESGVIPVNRAGINREFFASCPVIAGLNPKMGRFDQYETIISQVNVPPDTLSRYDLVFTLFDIPNTKDEIIANHISNLWIKTSNVHQQDYRSLNELSEAWGDDAYTPTIPLELLRKWISQAKKIRVRITPECAKEINSFFMDLRLQGADGQVPVVFRNLDGMMRLLIAETRLRHGTETTMKDVERVKRMVGESLKVIIDPATGKIDSDIITTGMSKSQRDKIKLLMETIESSEDATLDYLIDETGLPKEQIESILKKMMERGEVTEYRRGIYKSTR